MVIITHLTRAWDLDLFMPKSAEDVSPRLLQWPVLRIAPQGRIGVTIFAFLTGYVCALKPIRQARAGDPEAALMTVAKSAFRRGPRLIIPAAIITLGAAILAQLGAFTVARRTDSLWIFFGSPEQKSSIFDALNNIIYNILGTWTKEHNEYDLHQWTLFPLLKGSMLIYITLFGTIYMKSRYRMIASAGLYIYYYLCGDGRSHQLID
jgi:peptidoglycan/LPS O-acetylase OafA/YrhL